MPSLNDVDLRRVPFKSRRPRKPDPLLQEAAADVRCNNEFDVLFRLSKAEHGSKEQHLVILVNGFAELDRSLYHDTRLGLAHRLSEMGVASAFVPIPFHMHRLAHTEFRERLVRMHAAGQRKKVGPSWDEERSWAAVPAMIVLNSKERFYLGYRQLISDIRMLASAVQNSHDTNHIAFNSQYCDWFDDNTKVHFLGYSLGGLACLSAMIKSCIQGRTQAETGHTDPYPEPRIDKCILLFSGATFLDLDPTSMEIKQDKWDALREYYFSRKFQEELIKERSNLEELEAIFHKNKADMGLQSKIDKAWAKIASLEEIKTVKSSSYRLFERIVMGAPWNSDELKHVSKQILAILANRDRVNPAANLLRTDKDKRGFFELHIPALGHYPFESAASRDEWSTRLPFVASAIREFLEYGPLM